MSRGKTVFVFEKNAKANERKIPNTKTNYPAAASSYQRRLALSRKRLCAKMSLPRSTALTVAKPRQTAKILNTMKSMSMREPMSEMARRLMTDNQSSTPIPH